MDIEDLRAGINRLGIPQPSQANEQPVRAAANAEIQQPLVATLSPDAQKLKKKRRAVSENLKESAFFKESGRQDLNLRPLGPEPQELFFHGLSRGGTGSQGVEEIESAAMSPFHGVAQIPSSVTRRGAPVVRKNRAQNGGGRLLTVSEVAERLSLCRATIYQLCKDGDLACVRILNAVRIPADELERFLADRKNAS